MHTTLFESLGDNFFPSQDIFRRLVLWQPSVCSWLLISPAFQLENIPAFIFTQAFMPAAIPNRTYPWSLLPSLSSSLRIPIFRLCLCLCSSGNTSFSLRRAKAFSAFCFPTAALHLAKPSDLFFCDSSAWWDQSPPWVSSRSDLLLQTHSRVPFYPINTVNFPDPFFHIFPPVSSLLPSIPISPSSALG